MPTATLIPGKDAALEHSIARFQQQLTQLGFNIQEVSWLNPAPNVWSVHIADRDCPQCFTNGKGTSKKAALASALGEFFERLSCNYFFADFYLGEQIAHSEFVHYPNERWFELTDDDSLPEGLLDQHLLDFYQQEAPLAASQLIDLQSANEERGICALPFIRQSDQEQVFIPVNIIGNLYVSNGMSAGNNRYEARTQALSEICERYVKQRVLTEAISLPHIPASVLAQHPNSHTALAYLAEQGFPTLALDASLGGVFPVVCVLLFNPENGGCFASFGAHPTFAIALERTVTELLQGRNLKQLDVFPAPSFANDEVADPTNLETHFTDSSGLFGWDSLRKTPDFAYCTWDFQGDTQTTFKHLVQLIEQQDFSIYIADYQHLGVDACRILVPGMSEIYPIEDLFYANNNAGNDWRELICQLPNTEAQAEDYLGLIETIEEDNLSDDLLLAEFLGLAVAANTPWGSLRIGELKAMLALAAGEHQLALDWVRWTLDFNTSTFAKSRRQHYLCLAALLEFQLERAPQSWPDYADAFALAYGTQQVADCHAVLLGEQRFYGLTALDNNLSQLPSQQKLIQAYQKLQCSK